MKRLIVLSLLVIGINSNVHATGNVYTKGDSEFLINCRIFTYTVVSAIFADKIEDYNTIEFLKADTNLLLALETENTIRDTKEVKELISLHKEIRDLRLDLITVSKQKRNSEDISKVMKLTKEFLKQCGEFIK